MSFAPAPIVPRVVHTILNGSDMPRSILAARHGGCVIPFSGKEMRRSTRAEGLKLAHEMGLIGVPVCQGEIGPCKRRAHARLPPGARKTREPLEAFRRHAQFVEK